MGGNSVLGEPPALTHFPDSNSHPSGQGWTSLVKKVGARGTWLA